MSYNLSENSGEKKFSFVFVVEGNPGGRQKKDKDTEIDSRGNYVVKGSFRNTASRHQGMGISQATPSYLVVLEQ